MYHKILLALLFLIVIYLLYQNYNIQREIYKIKNSFEELNNFLDLSIKKTKPKVLDTLSSINTTDITDNIVTYSNDVKRVPPEATVNSEEQVANAAQENNENNEDNNENEHNQDIEIVHIQDSSDNDMGSFNLRVFNNIKNSLVTQLNTSSPNEEVNKIVNNLVVLSPKDSDTSETASSETASSETASSETASSKSASSKSASSKSVSSKSASSETASSKSESPKKIKAPVIEIVKTSPKISPTQSPTQLIQLSESVSKDINKKIYTAEELNKLTIVNIKEIAKQLNIVLSVTGKLKNKATLVSDILRLQE